MCDPTSNDDRGCARKTASALADVDVETACFSNRLPDSGNTTLCYLLTLESTHGGTSLPALDELASWHYFWQAFGVVVKPAESLLVRRRICDGRCRIRRCDLDVLTSVMCYSSIVVS